MHISTDTFDNLCYMFLFVKNNTRSVSLSFPTKIHTYTQTT